MDSTDARPTGESPKAVRYRTRFHREVIDSGLFMNDTISPQQIAGAVAINQPPEFLPQPWPPSAMENVSSIQRVALMKMLALLNVGPWLPEVGSAELSRIISERFPGRTSIATNESGITCCEVVIRLDGSVTSAFDFAADPFFAGGDMAKRLGYAKTMSILGMRTFLERLS